MDGVAKTDGKFSSETHLWADTADVYVMHVSVPEPYYSDETPLVIMFHGAPLYSMQTELYGLEQGNPTPWNTILRYLKRQEPTWFVSLWEEEQGDYWRAVAGEHQKDRLRFIPRGVRFGEEWTVDGSKRDLDGNPVIVVADQFRYFKDAIPCLFGAYQYWLHNPKARLHLFGLPEKGHPARETIERWLAESELHRMIGSVNGIVNYLPEVFRAADVLLSTVPGESRVALEAQACGCAVAAPWPGADATVLDFWQPERLADGIASIIWGEGIPDSCDERRKGRAAKVREVFDIRKTAEGMKALYEEILDGVG